MAHENYCLLLLILRYSLSLSSINGMMGPTKVAGVNDTSYDAKDESDNTDDDDTDS